MVSAAAPGLVAPNDCTHQWLIDPPNGRESIGHCLRCDSRRTFYNSMPEDKRVNNSDLFANRRGARKEHWNDATADADRELYDRFGSGPRPVEYGYER